MPDLGSIEKDTFMPVSRLHGSRTRKGKHSLSLYSAFSHSCIDSACSSCRAPDVHNPHYFDGINPTRADNHENEEVSDEDPDLCMLEVRDKSGTDASAKPETSKSMIGRSNQEEETDLLQERDPWERGLSHRVWAEACPYRVRIPAH